MANPLNPLDWLKSAQNWFVKTERSSGFRPYLIFLILILGFSITIFTFFKSSEQIVFVVLCMVILSAGWFILLFTVKSFQDPNFCRSEKHIESLRKIEMEKMGTETTQVDAEALETKAIEGPN